MPSLKSVVATWTTLLAAGSAGATVTINHTSTFPGFGNIGETFTVAVRLHWDGQGALQEVTSSTTFDPSVVQFIGASDPASSILAYTGDLGDPNDDVPGLSRLGSLIQPGEPSNVIRTVQYGGDVPVSPLAATSASGRLITTLNFRLIAAGVTQIRTLIAIGDSGAVGDTFQAGTSVTAGWVPEPGTALLLGVGLTLLGLRRP